MEDRSLFGHFQVNDGAGSNEIVGGSFLCDANQALAVNFEQLIASL